MSTATVWIPRDAAALAAGADEVAHALRAAAAHLGKSPRLVRTSHHPR